jgi:hypothetical protein
VTEKDEDFQHIKFVANGEVLAVATHDGRMMRFVKEVDGSPLKSCYRGVTYADISSISSQEISNNSSLWYIASTSNQTATCHIYILDTNDKEKQNDTEK